MALATLCSLTIPQPAYAYVDPSVMTYTIQALAGVAVALSALAGVMFRRMRRQIFKLLRIDENARKAQDPAMHRLDPKSPTYQNDLARADEVALEAIATARGKSAQPAKWPKRFATQALLPIILLIVTVGIVQPSQLFLGNVNEFLAPYSEIIPIIAAISAALLLALTAFTALFGKRTRIAAALIFGMALGAFIQGNFLNGSLPQLDGRQVDWGSYTADLVISTVVWVACIAIPLAIAIRNESLMNAISNAGSAILTMVQVVILAILLTTSTNPAASSYVATTSNQFTVSQNKSTIVIVLDTLEAAWFEDYATRHPEANEKLKDFTFYSDVVAEGAPTILGMPTMLTGVPYNCDRPVEQYQQEAYASSLRKPKKPTCSACFATGSGPGPRSRPTARGSTSGR